MKITKDTEVAVDVRKCSKKERRLVIEVLKRFHNEADLPSAERQAARQAGYIDFNVIEAVWSWADDEAHVDSISFKKFLKAVNPYKDIRYLVIDQPDESTLKRIKKMGYEERHNLPMDMCKSIALETGATYFMHSHGCSSLNDHISKERFMNLEPLTPVSPPLRFRNWDVSVEENTIKVGCKTFCKDDLEGFLRVCDQTNSHVIGTREAWLFLKENKEELGLT